MTDRIDELYEALTIEKSVVGAVSPPYGGYHSDWTRWKNWDWPVAGFDEVYKNAQGKLHRIYGPAYISKRYQIEKWYKDGILHRANGPAVIHKNSRIWYYEGKLHRLDGPAIVNLGEAKQYWIDGVRYSPKEYKKEIARRWRKGLINVVVS